MNKLQIGTVLRNIGLWGQLACGLLVGIPTISFLLVTIVACLPILITFLGLWALGLKLTGGKFEWDWKKGVGRLRIIEDEVIYVHPQGRHHDY